MQELDIALVKKKTIKGVVALTRRTFILQIIGFVSIFLLGIYLDQSAFGIFGIVSSFIAFLGYFSDIGLAAALIQKKEDVTQEDLATTFTIQQFLVGTLIIVSFLFSRAVSDFYRLDEAGVWLFRALLVSFFLSSLKTIPSIILERSLEFDKLVVPQILETLGYYIVTVYLAYRGFGIWSFTWGALVRGVVGVVAIYVIAPWRIRLGLNWTVARKLFRFGIPFQWNSFLALAKDDMLYLFLGRILTHSDLGLIVWAKKWAEVPLRLIMDNAIRVTFPVFSRLQGHKETLTRAVEKTLFAVSTLVFPLYAGAIFFIAPFVDLVPSYEKWEPALISFYILCIVSVFASLSTPLTNTLNAIGRIRVTLLFMAGWTLTTWILTIAFVSMFGFNGFATALLIVSSSLALVVLITKRYVSFSFIKSIQAPLIAVIPQLIVYALFVRRMQPIVSSMGCTSISTEIFGGGLLRTLCILSGYSVLGIGGVILYVAVLWRFERVRIQGILRSMRS